MTSHIILGFFIIIITVKAQVRIGEFYFPVTVQPPSFEIQKNDQTDTVYDEIVNIQTDNEITIPNINKDLIGGTSDKQKAAFSLSSKFKSPDSSYKTDEISSKDMHSDGKALIPNKAIQFKIDSGIPLTSPIPSTIPISMEPVITMSHSIVSNKDEPEISSNTLSPLPLISDQIDISNDLSDKQENTSVTKKMEVIVPKLETDIQRLDLEVSVLKDLVRKILRHVYRDKRKTMKSLQSQISGSSLIKENLRAVQTLDSSSSEPFLHTWPNFNPRTRFNSIHS